ncbi:hypothetical protein KKD57_03185 [Patescibacteria group bacterium]|nr:hypothetical protein [Patescibacteria group bacterium]
MSGYTDIKSKKFKRDILKWLESIGLEIKSAGKHQIKIKCIHNGKSFPVPANHPEINKYMIDNLMKFLVTNEMCTKEEFDERIK